MNEGKCFFTKEKAELSTLQGRDGTLFYTEACGRYQIDGESFQILQGDHALSKQANINCAFETIKVNEQGISPIWYYGKSNEISNLTEGVVSRDIEKYQDIPIIHSDKLNNTLNLVVKKLGKMGPFEKIFFDVKDAYSLKMDGPYELAEWLITLYNQSLITFIDEVKDALSSRNIKMMKENAISTMFKHPSVGLSTTAWTKLKEEKADSNNVFIAMAFTDNSPERNRIEGGTREAIKLVCEGLGWSPSIVDEVEHNDGVMDKVVSLINQSKFVIAELTYQKTGVYYEAGYAKGRDLPVIHVVQKDELKECHFDIKHLNLVVWEDENDLKEKLHNRIEATIGKRAN